MENRPLERRRRPGWRLWLILIFLGSLTLATTGHGWLEAGSRGSGLLSPGQGMGTAPTSSPVDSVPGGPVPLPMCPCTDAQLRQWYVTEAARVSVLDPQWKAQGLSAEERARRAYTIRRQARLKARELMESRAAVMGLEARDLLKYGHAAGPTFEQLLKKARREGLEGDAVYEAIIQSSQRTHQGVNRQLHVETPVPSPAP